MTRARKQIVLAVHFPGVNSTTVWSDPRSGSQIDPASFVHLARKAEAGRAPEGPVDSIRALFGALRGCWEPPASNEALHGMQMSVRFSFKRTGETVAPPRLTYASSNANADTRRIYREAIDAMLARCTPMPFSRRMGGAIAGRPIAIRFVDDRE